MLMTPLSQNTQLRISFRRRLWPFPFLAICPIRHELPKDKDPGELNSIALRYGLDERGLESQKGLGILLFTTASRPAVGPNQPPIQWVLGALSLGIKRDGSETDHSPPSSAEVNNAWSYTSTPPIRLNGVVLR
jgi:hypothetical protein